MSCVSEGQVHLSYVFFQRSNNKWIAYSRRQIFANRYVCVCVERDIVKLPI